MGSQRLLYDMENHKFPIPFDEKDGMELTITPDDISLFIEFSQLSHSGGVFAHILEDNAEVNHSKKQCFVCLSILRKK